MKGSILSLFLCLTVGGVLSEDIVCSSGTKSTDVVINKGDVFKFSTAGKRYPVNADCSGNYQLGDCPAAEVTCTKFKTAANKKCTKGDIMTVTDDNGTSKFCKKKKPVNKVLSGDFSIRFTSDGKKQSKGMKCTVKCTDDGSGSGSPSQPSNEKYCEISSDHTMCKYSGPSAACTAKLQFRELSDAARTAILDKHNELRSKVALGQEANQPAAANMLKLVWDTELENIAQRLADQCIFQHDSNREKLDGTSVGQNVYFAGSSVLSSEEEVQGSAAGSVQAWYDEVTDPGFNPSNINPYSFSSGTGHYTQVVWAETSSVGCGSVYYLESGFYKNLIVCNYAKAGNWIGSSMYAEGAACSQCPSGASCSDGLCVL